MNTLESIRTRRGLTLEQLGKIAGYDRPTAWKHCQANKLSAEAAIKYSAALGVPLSQLRPDLPTPICKDVGAEEVQP